MLIFLVVPNFTYAYIWNIGNPMCTGLGEYATKFCNFLWKIESILYILSAAVAVIFVVVGGIMYVTAGESEDKVKQAKKTVINALIGVAIIVAAGFLVGIVNEIITSNLS